MAKTEIKRQRAELVLRGQARRGGRLGGTACPCGEGRATFARGSGYLLAKGPATFRRADGIMV